MKKHILLFGITLLQILFFEKPVQAQVNEGAVPDADEFLALTALYDATSQAGVWTNESNWFNGVYTGNYVTNDYFGLWHGVTVVNGDVVALELQGNNLDGSLPEDLTRLQQLKILDLSGNNIRGSLPEWFYVFQHLEKLDLSFNALSGGIPPYFCYQFTLTSLNLSYNGLSGTIPDEIGYMYELRTLNLSNNAFNQGVSSVFYTFPVLEELRLNNNQFTEPLPEANTIHMPNLLVLDLAENQFTGRIPDFSGLAVLTSLNLYGNQLTGPFPVSLTGLGNLTYLNLGFNRLSGLLPGQLGNLTSLTTLYLHSNAFSGKVPQQLDNLAMLAELFLHNNQFSELPAYSGLHPDLHFRVGDNKIDLYDLNAYFTAANTTNYHTFNYAPQTPLQRTEVVTYMAGDQVNLNVPVGSSRFRHQWQKLIHNVWTNITPAVQYGHNLILSAATASDAGLYRCLLSHTWATQVTHPSKEILLKLKDAPQPPTIDDIYTADTEYAWVIERTYGDNEAIVAETKTFADGFGRPLQTQALNVTEQQVLATQTLYDLRGAAALTTLPAPTNNRKFSFKTHLLTDVQANPYGTANFDGAKTDNPDPAGNAGAGTAGWYYSNNNTLDETVAHTAYPYSRTESYTGPAAMVSRTTLPGDHHKPGSGKEIYTAAFPVLDELEHYLSLRHHFVPTSTDAALRLKAMKQVTRDPQGKESVSFTDQNGNAIASCLTGGSYAGIDITAVINSNPAIGAPQYMDLHLAPGPGATVQVTVQGGGAINVLDLGRDLSRAGAGTAYNNLSVGAPLVLNLAPGYYRFTSVSQNQEVRYDAYYGDFRYNYYDDAGRLVAAVDPKGVDRGSTATPAFTTTYQYGGTGSLLRTVSPDAGATEFVYRRDGSIRFSQSAPQKIGKKFSYTNYDKAGRIIEAGEYTMAASTGTGQHFQSQLTADLPVAMLSNSVLQPAVLESTAPGGGLDPNRCSQVTRTWYDLPDAGFTLRTPRFLAGRVSKTGNDNSTSWYSYDEQGRLEWLVTSSGLGTKTVDYTYDFNGNVLTAVYQKDNTAEQFHHRYTYDADLRLKLVETSSDGATWLPQAAYSYYLHGPLKRVVLGDRLQGLDYTYTVQGWLKGINHGTAAYDPGEDGQSNEVRPDLFGLTLEYFSGDYTSKHLGGSFTVNGNPEQRHDGLIKAGSWHTLGQRPKAYAYTYDGQNRFLRADYGFLSGPVNERLLLADPTGAFKETAAGYDAHGNLAGLQRTDAFGTTTADYTYRYATGANWLQNVEQGGQTVQASAYNAGGELLQQTGPAGSQYFTYEATGRVKAIYRNPNKTIPAAEFFYDERGNRQLKKEYDVNGNLAMQTWYATDAAGNVLSVYSQEPYAAVPERVEVPVYGTGRLGMLRRSPEGSWSYDYELQDNLGSTRVVFRSLVRQQQEESMERTSGQRRADGQANGFERVDETRHLDAARARTGSYSALLSTARGTGNGPNQTLNVRKGDSIMAEVYGYFMAPRKARWLPFAIAPVAGLFGKAATGSGAAAGTEAGKSAGIATLGAGLRLTGAAGAAGGAGVLASSGVPRAYLRLWIYDVDDVLVRTMEVYLSDSAGVGYERLAMEYRVEEDGYVKVEVINEDRQDVYFNDFRVAFSGLQVLEKYHLYRMASL